MIHARSRIWLIFCTVVYLCTLFVNMELFGSNSVPLCFPGGPPREPFLIYFPFDFRGSLAASFSDNLQWKSNKNNSNKSHQLAFTNVCANLTEYSWEIFSGPSFAATWPVNETMKKVKNFMGQYLDSYNATNQSNHTQSITEWCGFVPCLQTRGFLLTLCTAQARKWLFWRFAHLCIKKLRLDVPQKIFKKV